MQIQFSETVKKILSRSDEDNVAREAALSMARASKDSRTRIIEPTARQIRRQRHRNAESTAKVSRRAAFKQQKVRERQEQLLRTWARIYIGGRGNAEMRRNVTEAVHRQAEEYSKAAGEPFTKSLKRLEGELINAHLRDASRGWSKV